MSRQDEDLTDILLENKLLFEQLNELKASERQYLNERNSVEDLLDDEYRDLKTESYHDIILTLINNYYEKKLEYEKAISRAIEKEGEVITTNAKLNSVQQHCRIEQMKLEEELQQFKDKAKNEKDRQNLTTNEQIALLIQERDTTLANEQALAERVGDLMDEIVKLNEEIAKEKHQKLDMSLNSDAQNEEYLHLRRELGRMREEDDAQINNLQCELGKRQTRCSELEEEVTYLQKSSETQRQELQSAGDSAGSQQIELFQFKAKIKDLQDQTGVLNRQIGTFKGTNDTLNNDNQLLVEKFVDLSEKYSKKEDTLRDLQRDYKYKLEEVEKIAELEKEKHDTVEAQYSEMKESLITLQTQMNSLRSQSNKAIRNRADIHADNEQLKADIENLKYDKQELLKQLTSEDETLQMLLKNQDELSKTREAQLQENIDTVTEKLGAAQDVVDEKEGQISLLQHTIAEKQSMIEKLQERLDTAQSASLEAQKRSISAERDVEILQQNVEELTRELGEITVQLECYEEDASRCKEAICTIEIFTGSEMKHLYTNISLLNNIEKLRDWILDNNQILGNHKRKIEAITGEVRNTHEQNQQQKEKLHVSQNENVTLQSQLTSATAHLTSSHKEIRQLREAVLKGEKGKRVMERRVHSIEQALAEMQNFIHAATAKHIDSSKAKEVYQNLQNVVNDLLTNSDPTKQAIEVELVIDELNVLREEIRAIQQQHAAVVAERDGLGKKLVHEQNWVDKLRQKEELLTRTLDEKNEQLSSIKYELQLRERLLSDKERAFQVKKGQLEEEIKTMKKRYKSLMSGEQCGHQGLLLEVDQLRNQIQVARNTVQYKEQELGKLAEENEGFEARLKNSNTEQLHNEILKLNIANTRLQGQLSGANGENEEMSHAEERNNLLKVISQSKIDMEESHRKLYQSELRSETLVTAIEELKSNHELERERYKRDLSDFHERVTTQKEQLNRSVTELGELTKRYLETKKQKELAEAEAIRLGERVQQMRDSTNVESEKISRLEKGLDRKTEALSALGEKCSTAEAKVHEQEVLISQLQRNNLALEQNKTTLQLNYADVLQKYEKERDRFESIKEKLKTKAKNYKSHYEKENHALVNKSALLEEETALLKLHVNKEESWRRTTEKVYGEWRNRNRELETSCATLEEEVRLQRSDLHALNCTLSGRQEEVAALSAELEHVSTARSHYERMYRDLEVRSRASRADLGNVTHPILGANVVCSTPIISRSPTAGGTTHTSGAQRDSPLTSAESRALHDTSDKSQLTLEEEGLTLDDPNRPGGVHINLLTTLASIPLTEISHHSTSPLHTRNTTTTPPRHTAP